MSDAAINHNVAEDFKRLSASMDTLDGVCSHIPSGATKEGAEMRISLVIAQACLLKLLDAAAKGKPISAGATAAVSGGEAEQGTRRNQGEQAGPVDIDSLLTAAETLGEVIQAAKAKETSAAANVLHLAMTQSFLSDIAHKMHDGATLPEAVQDVAEGGSTAL